MLALLVNQPPCCQLPCYSLTSSPLSIFGVENWRRRRWRRITTRMPVAARILPPASPLQGTEPQRRVDFIVWGFELRRKWLLGLGWAWITLTKAAQIAISVCIMEIDHRQRIIIGIRKPTPYSICRYLSTHFFKYSKTVASGDGWWVLLTVNRCIKADRYYADFSPEILINSAFTETYDLNSKYK